MRTNITALTVLRLGCGNTVLLQSQRLRERGNIPVGDLGHGAIQCEQKAWFWSLPYVTKETPGGLCLGCAVVEEPVICSAHRAAALTWP